MVFPRYFGHLVKTLLLTLVFHIPPDCNSQEMNVIFLGCKRFRCIRIFLFEPVSLFHRFSDKSIPLLRYDRNSPSRHYLKQLPLRLMEHSILFFKRSSWYNSLAYWLPRSECKSKSTESFLCFKAI